MYYHGTCAAKDGISTKFGTVPHAVMPSIPCNDNAVTKLFQFFQSLTSGSSSSKSK